MTVLGVLIIVALLLAVDSRERANKRAHFEFRTQRQVTGLAHARGYIITNFIVCAVNTYNMAVAGEPAAYNFAN